MYFISKMAWRYFTGLHLDGKIRCSGRGSVLPRYSNYFWNRYSRKRRAAWRNCIFWLFIASGYGLVFDRQDTIYAMLAFTPFAAFNLIRKVIDALTQVTTFTDGDGVQTRYRVMRPKVRRWMRAHKPTRWRIAVPDGGPVPADIQRAILADNAEDGGEPILNMRVPTALQMEANNGRKPVGRNPYKRSSK